MTAEEARELAESVWVGAVMDKIKLAAQQGHTHIKVNTLSGDAQWWLACHGYTVVQVATETGTHVEVSW